MTTTRTYAVPGISCGHCKAAIEGEVTKLADVQAVDVDIDAKTVAVTGTASEQDVRAAIDEAGYDVATVS
jgi:copper chaperone